MKKFKSQFSNHPSLLQKGQSLSPFQSTMKHQDSEDISFIIKMKESQKKKSQQKFFLNILDPKFSDHNNISKCKIRINSNLNQIQRKKSFINSKKMLLTIFRKRDNRIQKNKKAVIGKYPSMFKIKQNHSKRSILLKQWSEEAQYSQKFIPLKITKDLFLNPNENEKRDEDDEFLQELFESDSKITKNYLNQTKSLFENNILKIQKNLKFTRYQLHNYFSFYNALLMDTMKQKKCGLFLDFDKFKKDLSIILKVKRDIVEKVVSKNLQSGREVGPGENELFKFTKFLEIISQILEYNNQQKLIQFIEILYELTKQKLKYCELLSIIKQYRSQEQAKEIIDEIFNKLKKKEEEYLYKQELKQLCIFDSGVYLKLNNLLKS